MASIRFLIPALVLSISLVPIAYGEEKVNQVTVVDEFKVSKDQLVLVKEFGADDAAFKGDNRGNEERVEDKLDRVPPALVERIVGEFEQRGYKAAPYTDDAAVAGTLILDGELDTVNNGSGAARALVGFGAGQAKLIGTIKLFRAEKPDEVLVQGRVQGTSKGRGGLISAGSMENPTIKNFAINTVDATTGLNRKGKPAEIREK